MIRYHTFSLFYYGLSVKLVTTHIDDYLQAKLLEQLMQLYKDQYPDDHMVFVAVDVEKEAFHIGTSFDDEFLIVTLNAIVEQKMKGL